MTPEEYVALMDDPEFEPDEYMTDIDEFGERIELDDDALLPEYVPDLTPEELEELAEAHVYPGD